MKKRNIFFALGLASAASIVTENALYKKDKPLDAYGQKVRLFGKYLSTEIIGNVNMLLLYILELVKLHLSFLIKH